MQGVEYKRQGGEEEEEELLEIHYLFLFHSSVVVGGDEGMGGGAGEAGGGGGGGGVVGKSLTAWVIPHEGECVLRLCTELLAGRCEVKLNNPTTHPSTPHHHLHCATLQHSAASTPSFSPSFAPLVYY